MICEEEACGRLVRIDGPFCCQRKGKGGRPLHPGRCQAFQLAHRRLRHQSNERPCFNSNPMWCTAFSSDAREESELEQKRAEREGKRESILLEQREPLTWGGCFGGRTYVTAIFSRSFVRVFRNLQKAGDDHQFPHTNDPHQASHHAAFPRHDAFAVPFLPNPFFIFYVLLVVLYEREKTRTDPPLRVFSLERPA